MKSKLILGAILTLLLAVTSVSFAFASGDAKGDNNGDKVRILQVTLQHRGQEAQLDLGASGPSIGDRFIFSGNLVRNGKRVGVGAGDCVTVLFTPGPDPQGEPEAATDQCTATVSLPKGSPLGDLAACGVLPMPLAEWCSSTHRGTRAASAAPPPAPGRAP
jgi:hypothetical protein